MKKTLAYLGVFVLVVLVAISATLDGDKLLGYNPKAHKLVENVNLPFELHFLDSIKVYSDLECVVQTGVPFRLKYGELEIRADTTTGHYVTWRSDTLRFEDEDIGGGVWDTLITARIRRDTVVDSISPNIFKMTIQDTIVYDTTISEISIRSFIIDKIMVEDVVRLIDDRYAFSIVFARDVRITNVMQDAARQLMQNVGVWPPSYLQRLKSVTLTNTLYDDDGYDEDGSGMVAYYKPRDTLIVVDAQHVKESIAHEIGHFIDFQYSSHSYSWWIDEVNEQAYLGKDSTRLDSAYPGFIWGYGRTNRVEDIATIFEILNPEMLKGYLRRVDEDPVLAKKVKVVFGLTFNADGSVTKCTNRAYVDEFERLDFIPLLELQTGDNLDQKFWMDLSSGACTSSPEQGWYWHRRSILYIN